MAQGDTYSEAVTNNGNTGSILSAGIPNSNHAQGYSQNGSISDNNISNVNININYNLKNVFNNRPPQKGMHNKDYQTYDPSINRQFAMTPSG